MSDSASPVNADLSAAVHFAGFWIRLASMLIDGLLILVVIAGFVAIDFLVMDGELGSVGYSETVSVEVVEARTEKLEDGSVKTYTKSIETQRDSQGRLAKVQVEHTETRGNRLTSYVGSSRMLESDPGWGGKYALYFQFGLNISLIAYFLLMWSSKHQSTVGGKVFKLRVTDTQGKRISFLRALGRTAAAILSGVSIIGFYMIAFTKRKQGLHDKIAKTLVFRD